MFVHEFRLVVRYFSVDTCTYFNIVSLYSLVKENNLVVFNLFYLKFAPGNEGK